MAAGEAVPGGLCAPRKELTYANGQTVGIRLMSDLHVGAGNVDYKLIRREIDEAIKRKHRIVVNGDVFDAIVAHDKRFSPDVLHPRLQGKRDPLNAAVDWAAELFRGAEHLVDVVGLGNHETTVEKYSGIDICKLLVQALQRACRDPSHRIYFGGYGGFCAYTFKTERTAARKTRNAVTPQRLVIYYHHGAGGTAPVTGGLIDFHRKSTWVQADIVTMGHRHTRLVRDIQTIGLSVAGTLVVRKMLLVQTGAYFDTYGLQRQESYADHGRRSNYAADWGCAPQGKGGALLNVRLSSVSGGSMEITVTL